jgi:hypothetical protein
MDSFSPRAYKKKGPEKIIQDAIKDFLKIKDWYVMQTHGNMYQSGFPDLFACHSRYGQRWIEVKLPEMKGSKFTPAQLDCFPKLCAHGSGVWVLTAATEAEYAKLFKRPNWWTYLSIFK